MKMNYLHAIGLALLSLIVFSCTTEDAPKVVGRFAVSETQYVEFAPGNLQYQAGTKTWRFAPNAYDTIGANNAAISDSYDGWIDLFGWSTAANPTEHVSYDEDVEYYTHYSTEFADWGSNVIGTDRANTWRTLTQAEWKYLFFTRPNAEKLFAGATVNGVRGFILLPDNWEKPAKASLTPSMEKGLVYNKNFGLYSNDNATGDATSNFTHNILTIAEWKVLENAGAAFLPATGYRWGTKCIDTQSYCNYWTATLLSADGYPASYWAQFSWSTMSIGNSDIAIGAAVRLVRNIE